MEVNVICFLPRNSIAVTLCNLYDQQIPWWSLLLIYGDMTYRRLNGPMTCRVVKSSAICFKLEDKVVVLLARNQILWLQTSWGRKPTCLFRSFCSDLYTLNMDSAKIVSSFCCSQEASIKKTKQKLLYRIECVNHEERQTEKCQFVVWRKVITVL